MAAPQGLDRGVAGAAGADACCTERLPDLVGRACRLGGVNRLGRDFPSRDLLAGVFRVKIQGFAQWAEN